MGRAFLSLLIVMAAAAMAGCAAAPGQKAKAAVKSEAHASQPASEAAPVATTAAAEPDTMVCRMETTIGTRMAKRVCRTRAEIEGETQAARETMKTIERKGGNTRDPGMPSGGG